MPEQLLKRLRIAGWKSIQEATIELGPLAVLIGANGVGKSNLVSIFRLLNRLVADDLQTHVQQCGGANAVLHFGAKATPALELETTFTTPTGESRYAARLAFAAGDRLIFTDERRAFARPESAHPDEKILDIGHKESALKSNADEGDKTARVIRGLLSRCRVFHFHDTSDSSPMRRSCAISSNKHLYPDGGNLASMLYYYRKQEPTVYGRILSTVRQIAPFIHDFVLEPDRLNPTSISLKWTQPGSEYEFESLHISDGTLRMIALSSLLLQPEKDLPLLIVLDEPELGLHPSAIALLGSLVRKVSHSCQMILSTQSTALLDCFDVNDVVVVTSEDGATKFERLDRERLRDWLEGEYGYTVSELWEKNVIGGGPYQ